MKYTFLLLILATYLSSFEFKHIQPVSVEVAPLSKSTVQKVKSVPVVEAPKEQIDNSLNFSKNFEVKEDGTGKTIILRINFVENRWDIPYEYNDEIKEFVQYLEENDDYLVVIYGHTDSMGSEISNKELSYNRAKSVQKALEEYGIRSVRLTAIGKGELSPIADNSSEEGRAKNRRIEIDILE